MCGGVVDADYELRDLEGGEGLLDGFGDADGEGGYGVVCILWGVLAVILPNKILCGVGGGGENEPSKRGLQS